MMYTLLILHEIAKVAKLNGGAVRPIDVERNLKNDANLSGLKISSHKIRQLFKECKEDGLLRFDGYKYQWRERHWLNYAGIDILNSRKSVQS